MKFFAHKNFPAEAVELLRVFSGGSHDFEIFSDTYPHGALDTEWVPCLGKQALKPTILRIGGFGNNKVERNIFREAGCSFVCYADGWSNMPWQDLGWKLLKSWPEVILAIEDSNALSVFEVSINGKIRRTTL